MPDTHVTITGNLTDDPEVSFTPNGAAVCNFRLAVTARVKDGDSWRDGETSFFRVIVRHEARGDRAGMQGPCRRPVAAGW
jgi:single-strand DNA-binding protein